MLVRHRIRVEIKKSQPSTAEMEDLELMRSLLSAELFGSSSPEEASRLVDTLRAASVHTKPESSKIWLTSMIQNEERRERAKERCRGKPG